MTLSQATLLYEAMRSVDLSGVIEEICEEQAASATKRVASALEQGNLHQACMCRGEAKAWEQVPNVLKRKSQKGAPDRS